MGHPIENNIISIKESKARNNENYTIFFNNS